MLIICLFFLLHVEANPKTYFISFADTKYHQTLQRIGNEAVELHFFDSVYLYTDQVLNLQSSDSIIIQSLDADFWQQYGSFVEKNQRGFGYWIWKPYIVKYLLQRLDDNDILIYADAGCKLHPQGIKRLQQYIQMVNTSPYGILSFQMSQWPDTDYTKMDLVATIGNDFNLSEITIASMVNTGQLVGGIFVLRKCEHTQLLLEKWMYYASNPHNIDDTRSLLLNYPGFVEHRHDQSIFSLLRKIYGTVIIEDETDLHTDYNAEDDFYYPIHAARLRY